VGNEFTARTCCGRLSARIKLKAIGTFMQNAANAPDPKQWQGSRRPYCAGSAPDKPMPLICKILTNLYWYWYDRTEAKKHSTPDDPWATKWASTSLVAFGPYKIRSWKRAIAWSRDATRTIGRVHEDQAYHLSGRSGIGEPAGLLKEGKVDLIEGVSPTRRSALQWHPTCAWPGSRQPVDLIGDEQH